MKLVRIHKMNFFIKVIKHRIPIQCGSMKVKTCNKTLGVFLFDKENEVFTKIGEALTLKGCYEICKKYKGGK